MWEILVILSVLAAGSAVFLSVVHYLPRVFERLAAERSVRGSRAGDLEDRGGGVLSGQVDGWPVSARLDRRVAPPEIVVQVRGVCPGLQIGATRRTASPPIRTGAALLDRVLRVRGDDEVVVRGMLGAPLREALVRAASQGQISVDRGVLTLRRGRGDLDAMQREAVALARMLQAPVRALEAMVTVLKTDRDLGVRMEIVSALVRAGAIKREEMAAFLEVPHAGASERIDVAVFLDDPSALPAILRNDMQSDAVRQRALVELLRMDPGGESAALAVELMGDRKPKVREAAFSSLVALRGGIALAGALHVISGRLDDLEDDELVAAADAFRLLAATEAVEVLFELAFSRRAPVREAALRALGVVGDLEHVEVLSTLEGSGSAIRAIQERSGRAEGGEISVFDADGLTGAVSEAGGGEVSVAEVRPRRTPR